MPTMKKILSSEQVTEALDRLYQAVLDQLQKTLILGSITSMPL